jgi:hypothetical protein
MGKSNEKLNLLLVKKAYSYFLLLIATEIIMIKIYQNINNSLIFDKRLSI